MTAQRFSGELARGAARDVGFAWSLGLGIGLIALGLLGFVGDPLVGAPTAAWGTPLFLTGDAHDILNLVTGALLLYGALGLTPARRGALLLVVGAIGIGRFLLGLLSGDYLGLLGYPVNLPDQLLLLVTSAVSMVVGYVARGGSLRRAHPDAAATAGASPTDG